MSTKGDWTILGLERGHEDRIKIVSEVNNQGYFPLVCFVHGVANREANALLIAAAPDQNRALLEVLELTEGLLPTGEDIVEFRHKVQNIIRPALAKAEENPVEKEDLKK